MRAFPVPVKIEHAVITERNGSNLGSCCVVRVCVCSLGNVRPVDSTHFMGGLIRWRPVNPAAFDGTVRIGLSE